MLLTSGTASRTTQVYPLSAEVWNREGEKTTKCVLLCMWKRRRAVRALKICHSHSHLFVSVDCGYPVPTNTLFNL